DTVALPLAVRDVRPRSRRLGRRTVFGLLLAVGLGTTALLHGLRVPRPQTVTDALQPSPGAPQQPGTTSPQTLEESLDRELDMLRRRAGALEADLKGQTPEASDGFAGALGEQRRRLDAVEGELAG